MKILWMKFTRIFLVMIKKMNKNAGIKLSFESESGDARNKEWTAASEYYSGLLKRIRDKIYENISNMCGKGQRKLLQEAIAEYAKRLSRYCKLEILEGR